jgi:hypothetical protein
MQIHAKRQQNETTSLDLIQFSGRVVGRVLSNANLQPLVLAGGYLVALQTPTVRSGPGARDLLSLNFLFWDA